MKFGETTIQGAWIVEPDVHADSRGVFFRTWCEREFSEIGFSEKWVQSNYSVAVNKGTIRGMHYQLPPHPEAKLVRCVKGKIRDVIIDLRADSSTFKKVFSAELSEENRLSLLIPKGCAHGFQTLQNDCHLTYFHSAFYAPEHEAGIRFDDPFLQFSWPLPVTELSERDRNFSFLPQTFNGINC